MTRPSLPLIYPRLRVGTHTGTEWQRQRQSDREEGRQEGKRGPLRCPRALTNTGVGGGSERAQAASSEDQDRGPAGRGALSRRLPGQSSATVGRTRPGSRVENKQGSEVPRRHRACARMHSLTRPALVPRARKHQVTTRTDTSHYEYCFQREAIHGITTSTEGLLR